MFSDQEAVSDATEYSRQRAEQCRQEKMTTFERNDKLDSERPIKVKHN